MINATKETLNSFFTGGLQYVVPFYQRSYVWNEENWEILWEHLTKVAERTGQSIKTEHFIGTLITKQQQSERIGEVKLDIIDNLLHFCKHIAKAPQANAATKALAKSLQKT